MTLNCKGNLVDLSIPKVMGILNVTTDSFYDGGKYRTESDILGRADKMLVDGASFIDIGAYSSRPGAVPVPEEAELKRALTATELILKEFPDTLLSIDTFRSKVAQKCLEAGACIVNDISAGLLDNDMLPMVAKFKPPYIMMHMKGNPQTMQNNVRYKNLLGDILSYFSERMAAAKALKINDIVIDPGFGFAKTLDQNYELLQKLDLFQILDAPILAGLSRKSMIYNVLGRNAEEALNGTTALNMIALSKGANILRVHDVKEALECIKLNDQFPK